jgi:hypothetical protein
MISWTVMKSLLDAAICTTKDAWNVEFFGRNLGDARTQLLRERWLHLRTPNRPRTLGVRFGCRF